jgi:hypothetical protein
LPQRQKSTILNILKRKKGYKPSAKGEDSWEDEGKCEEGKKTRKFPLKGNNGEKKPQEQASTMSVGLTAFSMSMPVQDDAEPKSKKSMVKLCRNWQVPNRNLVSRSQYNQRYQATAGPGGNPKMAPKGRHRACAKTHAL